MQQDNLKRLHPTKGDDDNNDGEREPIMYNNNNNNNTDNNNSHNLCIIYNNLSWINDYYGGGTKQITKQRFNTK